MPRLTGFILMVSSLHHSGSIQEVAHARGRRIQYGRINDKVLCNVSGQFERVNEKGKVYFMGHQKDG